MIGNNASDLSLLDFNPPLAFANAAARQSIRVGL
jgi:hypothetical protein